MSEGYPVVGSRQDPSSVAVDAIRKECEDFLGAYCLQIPSAALIGDVVDNAEWWSSFIRDLKMFLPLMPFQVRLSLQSEVFLAHPTATPVYGPELQYSPPIADDGESRTFEVLEIARRDLDPRDYYLWLQDFDALYAHPQAVIGSDEACKSPFTHLDIAAVLAVNASKYTDYLPEQHLVAVLLLRDGRFCYVMESSDIADTCDDSYYGWQGLGCNSAAVVTSRTLQALVDFALDAAARRLLGLSHVDEEPMKIYQSPAIWVHAGDVEGCEYPGSSGLRWWPGHAALRLRHSIDAVREACEDGEELSYARMGVLLWSNRQSESEYKDDPSRIVPLSMDGKDMIGTGLDGEEAFRVQEWSAMPCQDLVERIGKAWNVSPKRLVVLDNDRELLATDVIAHARCLTLKKSEEPASRRFARDLYQAYVEGEEKAQEYLYRSMPRVHALEEEGKLEEEEEEKTKPRPKLERQRSTFGERKDKAREKMRADWSWQEDAEVRLYKQVQDWCKAQLPQEKQEPAPSLEASNTSSAMEAPEGTILVASKADQAEFGVGPTAKHKSHKHHKNKKGAGHGAMHNVQTLKLFASLGLNVPTTPEECLKIVDDMEASLAAHREEEEQRRGKEVEYWIRKKERPEGAAPQHAWPTLNTWQQNVNVWSWGPTWGKLHGHGGTLEPKGEEAADKEADSAVAS